MSFYNALPHTIVRTKIFELCNGKYKNFSRLAQTMGISVSQIYRVRQGKRNINQKFIIGAMQAFPEYKFDDLFYLSPRLPTIISKLKDSPVNKSKEKG